MLRYSSFIISRVIWFLLSSFISLLFVLNHKSKLKAGCLWNTKGWVHISTFNWNIKYKIFWQSKNRMEKSSCFDYLGMIWLKSMSVFNFVIKGIFKFTTMKKTAPKCPPVLGFLPLKKLLIFISVTWVNDN